MNAHEFSELSAGHALNALSPDDERAFQDAMAQHPEWLSIFRADLGTAAELSAGVEEVRPPEQVRDELIAAIRRTLLSETLRPQPTEPATAPDATESGDATDATDAAGAADAAHWDDIAESPDESRPDAADDDGAVAEAPPIATDAPVVAAPLPAVDETDPVAPRAQPLEPPPTTEAVQTVARRNWTGGLLALAAAFVVLIAIGTAVVVIGDRLRAPASDRALETVEAAPDAESATVDIIDGGTATAHWSPSLGTAVLVTVGLERAGADRDFQVWFQRGGESIPAGHFDTSADGGSTTVLEGDVQEGDVITVTVEPAGGSDQPSGEPIIEIPTATL